MNGILNDLDLTALIENQSTYEYSNLVKHLLIYDIFNNLPRLDENERRARENVYRDPLFIKDNLKEYYQFLKKKYTNFIQLAYVDDELLHEFYEYQNTYDTQKKNMIIQFDLIPYLQNFYRGPKANSNNMNDFQFKKVIEKNLFSNNGEEELNNPLWNKININKAFADRRNNQVLLNLLKFNPDLNQKNIYLDISLIYKNIDEDLASIFYNKSDINQIVLEFSDKEYFSKKNVYPYESDEKYHSDINKVFTIIIKNLKNCDKIKSLVLVAEKFTINLNENNSSDLINLIKKNQLFIFTMKNLILPATKNNEFLQAIYNSRALKFFHLEGIHFDKKALNDFESVYNDKNKLCYFSFDEAHTVEFLI